MSSNCQDSFVSAPGPESGMGNEEGLVDFYSCEQCRWHVLCKEVASERARPSPTYLEGVYAL
jgi:hypothetical protein